MLPYSDYKKSRRIFETYFLIKSGQANTKKQLADIFETDVKTISNYIDELNNDFGTDIYVKEGRYVIDHEGIMGLMKRSFPLTADDVMIIISSLIQSQSFMETKMTIIKNSLLGLLPEEESKKLKDMLYFHKKNDHENQNIEFNITKIRKAITEEKEITFTYKNYEENHKLFKLIPYSFACEMGKYYLIGKPDNIDSLIHLRIDRMGDIRILDEEGKREDKFNVYNYLKKTWYMYSGEEIKVLVKFRECCYKVVTERNMSEGRVVADEGDYFTYEFICNGTKGIKLWLMGFGGDAEVLEPLELRNEMKEAAMDMVKIYGE